MRFFKTTLAITSAALVLSGAAFDATARQKRKAAKDATTATPAPADKQNARPGDGASRPADSGADAANGGGAAKKNARAADPSPAQSPAGTSAAAAAEGPRYSFEFSQPNFLVSRYVIEHDAAGRARLSFSRKTDGLNEPPVVEQFDISPAASARILSAWGALRFLDSQESYQADKQFPHLGTMRLAMRDGGRARTAEFNWTHDDRASALVREYRALAEQQFFLFDMALARQYQPSEAIKVLKRLEKLLEQQNVSDASQLLPLLRDLTTDERIPLIARNHAERLVKKIEKN